jgi:predicted small lipoprotein YifL
MKSTIILIAALLSLGILSACGQSGPLYVPGDPSSVQQPQPVPESEDNGDESGEEDDG